MGPRIRRLKGRAQEALVGVTLATLGVLTLLTLVLLASGPYIVAVWAVLHAGSCS